MNRRALLTALLCMAFGTTLFAQKKPPKELYVPMDYSTCGYHASEAPIPCQPATVKVDWQSGDCAPLLQRVIDQLATVKCDASGHRGTILIGEGDFRLDTPLRISASGIVLRGMGTDKTRLVKHGVDRGACIYIEGLCPTTLMSSGTDTLWVTADHVAAGSTTLPVTGRVTLRPGDRILITRPSTREWIEHLAMNDFGGGLDYTGWKPTDIDIVWDRTVTAVGNGGITIDSPITTTLSAAFGGAYIVPRPVDGELTECGVENLTILPAVDRQNPKDEDHCWDGIFIDHVRDCWVRRVNFQHLAGSAVSLQLSTSRITVEDCIASAPVSEVGGWRRCVFLTRGQQTLFQRCVSRQGIHDFAAGFRAAGPNAFVQCEGEESLGFSGSIGSWAAGLLFDIVNIDGHDLRFANLEQFQFGTGWNTANSMLWQCTASTIECYSPDPDNRNSAHGSWGTLTGNGEWTSSNDHVSPRSLYYDQLEKRLTDQNTAVSDAKTLADSLGRILPRSTNASSSPTVEQAMALAQESLTQPRLTLEAWIAGLPPIPTTVDKKKVKGLKVGKPAPSAKAVTGNRLSADIAVTEGHLTFNGLLITGDQYNIPWWSGRVKDNFVSREAKPAITRFVPGREGTGWTDRIDSVADYLNRHHYSSLHHHYGLWYDLRRTDHERVRRANGDVWAPFYEQPFARSGQGTAWDGLSRYDLTRPNKWYWQRLNDFASKTSPYGILLFHEHYFQHNILEAGAHWVDCPWRPVNNINATDFPEPVPFAGDKRIFIAEQFYNEQSDILRPLHQQYIRQCLDQLKDHGNVVHLISAEYTGPLHFTRFWLKTIAEWEAETGHKPLIALSCTRDAQDSIMADPQLSAMVGVIDIRYWHYNTDGLWAPEAGRNLAPRQWMRKMKVGKTGFEEVYRAVRECRDLYPDKAVTYYSQQYPAYGWAVLLAGGSLPAIPIAHTTTDPLQQTLLADLCHMRPVETQGGVALVDRQRGCLVYTLHDEVSIDVGSGTYDIYTIHPKTGAIHLQQKSVAVSDRYTPSSTPVGTLLWLRRK